MTAEGGSRLRARFDLLSVALNHYPNCVIISIYFFKLTEKEPVYRMYVQKETFFP